MKPAFSVICFTVLSGTGYGLVVWLALSTLLQRDPAVAMIGYPLAFIMISAGLLSSTLHLKSPARARFALSQWRTSWLSREGIAALLTFLPLLAVHWGLFVNGAHWHLAAVLAAIGSLATVFCTGMIYQTIRAVRAWATPMTSAAYLLAAFTGGGVFWLALQMTGGASVSTPAALIIGLALVGLMVIRHFWWRNLAAPSTSTVATATGLGGPGTVSLFERPHVTENWLTEEMGFRVARKHAARLRGISQLLTILPLAILLLVIMGAADMPLPATVIAVLFLTGTFLDRWLFFAEARHTVRLYYGASHA
ncbi:MAG: dimethyl sulfoxide reductase anchor subunit [Minwuia sp.]|nr:dimethyl sulfoxide reductase anchor subunit [Minwuia sp.]